MSNPASSLPDRWMQSLWSELRANYGARWDRMFPVPPVPPGVDASQHAMEHIATVQRIWAKKLGRFQSNPDAIRFALDNLPQDPPDLPKFDALCNRRPSKNEHLELPAPPVSREGLARLKANIAKSFAAPVDRLDPIRNLMAREMDGDKRLTKYQREFWRKCLRSELLAKTGIDTANSFSLSELCDALDPSAARARLEAHA